MYLSSTLLRLVHRSESVLLDDVVVGCCFACTQMFVVRAPDSPRSSCWQRPVAAEVATVVGDHADAAVNAKARAAAAKLTEQLFPGKLASDVLTPVRLIRLNSGLACGGLMSMGRFDVRLGSTCYIVHAHVRLQQSWIYCSARVVTTAHQQALPVTLTCSGDSACVVLASHPKTLVTRPSVVHVLMKLNMLVSAWLIDAQVSSCRHGARESLVSVAGGA